MLLSFAITSSYAQSYTAKSVKAGAITYTRPTFFKNGKFYVNGQHETFSEISTRLANANVSADEYNEIKKYRILNRTKAHAYSRRVRHGVRANVEDI